jgi:hypothetical protein
MYYPSRREINVDRLGSFLERSLSPSAVAVSDLARAGAVYGWQQSAMTQRKQSGYATFAVIPV